MSVTLSKNSLYLKNKDTRELQSVGLFGSGADKTLSEIKTYADSVKESTRADIDAKVAEAMQAVPEDVRTLNESVTELKEDLAQLIVIEESVNLFNKDENHLTNRAITHNKTIPDLVEKSGYDTYYIPIEVGKTYTYFTAHGYYGSTYGKVWCTYKDDAQGNKVFVKRNTNGVYNASTFVNTITVDESNAGAEYLGFTVQRTEASMVMFVEGSTYPSSYLPYFEPSKKLSNDVKISEENLDKNIIEAIESAKRIKPYYKFDAFGVWAVAHRGYMSTIPENTLPAFRVAKQKGFDFVETDLIWTSDGVCVLAHDDDITTNNRARNIDGTVIGHSVLISQSTYADLLQYDFGIYKGETWRGTKIPTLEELVKLGKALNICLDLEFKFAPSVEQITEVYNLLKSYGMEDSVVWCNGDPNILKSIVDVVPTAFALGYEVGASEATLTAYARCLTGANKVGLLVKKDYLTDSAFALAEQKEIRLGLYDCSDSDFIKNLSSKTLCVLTNGIPNPKELIYDNNIGDENGMN